MGKRNIEVTCGGEFIDENLIGKDCVVIVHIFGIGFRPSQIKMRLAPGWEPETCFHTIDAQINANIPGTVQIIKLVSFTEVI